VFCVLLVACKHQPVFYSYQPVPEKGWSRGDTLVFTPEIQDSNQIFTVFAEIRCFSTYNYEHLGLKYSYSSEHDKMTQQDTEFFKLRGVDGTWDKSGLAGLRLFTFPLKPLKANKTGKYDIKVVQNQTDSLLKGIFDVGIKILPANKAFN